MCGRGPVGGLLATAAAAAGLLGCVDSGGTTCADGRLCPVGTMCDDVHERCWGRNVAGESAPPAGTFDWVSANDDYTCGIRTNGAITCWGLVVR